MKAIIVIDMPKVCGECRASFCGDVWYCYAGEYRRPLFTENIQEKPSWCPLRPMPEQMSWGHTADYIEGYNACLEEITGEIE